MYQSRPARRSTASTAGSRAAQPERLRRAGRRRRGSSLMASQTAKKSDLDAEIAFLTRALKAPALPGSATDHSSRLRATAGYVGWLFIRGKVVTATVVRSGPLGSRGSPAAAAGRAAGVPHHQRPGRRVRSGTARASPPGTAPPAAGGTPAGNRRGEWSSIPATGNGSRHCGPAASPSTTCARSTPRPMPPTSWRPPTGHAGGLWRKSGSPTSRNDTTRPTAKLSRPLDIANSVLTNSGADELCGSRRTPSSGWI